MDRVKGKVAVVTGGASGIGRATARLLAKEGAQVVIADVNRNNGKDAINEIIKSGGSANYWHMDVTDENEVKEVFSEISKKYGRIDILVNNAGVPGVSKVTHETSTEDWERTINVDLKGVFFCTKYAIPYLKKARGSSIVNISSMLAMVGGGEDAVYQTAKGGVRIMTKADAITYARDGIRVNSVHPGYTFTPTMQIMLSKDSESKDLINTIVSTKVPLGRMGTPEEIANGILFLASDESSYITGTELVIDGGYIAQ
jgi:NAD(P)-dependent dehydrogenase (short-subunit alcohol dehydrogenase family)